MIGPVRLAQCLRKGVPNRTHSSRYHRQKWVVWAWRRAATAAADLGIGGRRAAWLPAQDWEALLGRPLDEVRAQLGLGEPPRYEPVRSARAPALAS